MTSLVTYVTSTQFKASQYEYRAPSRLLFDELRRQVKALTIGAAELRIKMSDCHMVDPSNNPLVGQVVLNVDRKLRMETGPAESNVSWRI